MPPFPDDPPAAPPGPARQGRETPQELGPHPQVDTTSRLRTTQMVLLALAAVILVAVVVLLLR